MSNQVYRNGANGGQKFYPQGAKNVYELQADFSASNSHYSPAEAGWDGVVWDKLNGTNVTATTVSGITTRNYVPVASTVDEIKPVSISNVDAATTYFYFLQTGTYHIEFEMVWSDVPGTMFVGIEISDYNQATNTWVRQPVQCRASGLQTNANNPLITGICVDKYFTTTQRMRAVWKVSNTCDAIAANVTLNGGCKLVISKSS